MSADQEVAIYTNHDRDLVFYGTPEEALEAGIRLHTKTKEVTINGERWKIVNQHITAEYLGLWIMADMRRGKLVRR